jgi:3-dehydroquinate synthetase
MLLYAMKNDKKKQNNSLFFVVPDEKSARIIKIENDAEMNIIKRIINTLL